MTPTRLYYAALIAARRLRCNWRGHPKRWWTYELNVDDVAVPVYCLGCQREMEIP